MVGMSKAKAENRPLPKRFYAAVEVQQNGGSFVITLDGKMVRTPKGNLLHCASQQLAQQLVAEWEAQVAVIDADVMPLTRLLNIALDRVELDREALLADIVGYAETDLVCYRAPMEPALHDSTAYGVGFLPSVDATLRGLQVQHFDPVLVWAASHHGIRMVVTEGLMPVPQPAASVQKIAALFAAANMHELAALALMVPILGSALLVLALWQGKITVEEALVAAWLDESVQAERWGEDAEVRDKWNAKARDVRVAAIFLAAHKNY